MPQIANLIWSIIVAGGGGAAVAFLIFRTLGSKWLDSKFEAQLQNVKHEHDRQIEELRFRGSQMLDRAAKLSAREFEALPEAWALVWEAYVQTGLALRRNRYHVDFTELSDEVARRMLERMKFESWEIDELLQKPKGDRTDYYNLRQVIHELVNAKEAVKEASKYLAKKALFLEREVHERLTLFVDETWQAVAALELLADIDDGPIPEGVPRDDLKYMETSHDKVKELEQFVQERFWGCPTQQ